MARYQRYVSPVLSHGMCANDWADPDAVFDLAVDSKKVEELKTWLSKFRNKCGILLLSGPTGCGKTATVRCLAKSLGFHLREWVTPLDRDCNNGAEFVSFESQVEKFDDFLYTCSRYSSLFSNGVAPNSLLLVEDYPNVFLRSCEAFHNVLSRYCLNARSPLVFICSEVADQNLKLISDLFPAHIQLKLAITQLSLNAVTKTRMMAALRRMGSLLNKLNLSFKPPTVETMSEICDNANGDVRYATLLLQIKPQEDTAALFDIAMKSKLRDKKGKHSKALNKGDSMEVLCEKDDKVGLLHGVGRVLNPKWQCSTEKKPHHLSKRKKTEEDRQMNASKSGAELVHNPDTIVNSFLSTAKRFLMFIHENYLNTFSNIDSVAAAASSLSLSDIVMTTEGYHVHHNISFDLTVRGLMINNQVPVRAWNPIRSPKYFGVIQIQKEVSSMVEALFQQYPVSVTILMMEYIPFMSHMNLNLSHDQKEVVINCASMEPLAKFCETFKSLRHGFRQPITELSKASFLFTQKCKSPVDDELHISEDESDDEVDEGSQNLSMLEAALKEEEAHEEDYRNLLNDSEADVFLSQL